MADKVLHARTVQIHDVEANWNRAVSFVPRRGEIVIYDVDKTHNVERFKIGDGTTTVVNLPFIIESSIQDFFKSTSDVIYIDSGRITDY